MSIQKFLLKASDIILQALLFMIMYFLPFDILFLTSYLAEGIYFLQKGNKGKAKSSGSVFIEKSIKN